MLCSDARIDVSIWRAPFEMAPVVFWVTYCEVRDTERPCGILPAGLLIAWQLRSERRASRKAYASKELELEQHKMIVLKVDLSCFMSDGTCLRHSLIEGILHLIRLQRVTNMLALFARTRRANAPKMSSLTCGHGYSPQQAGAKGSSMKSRNCRELNTKDTATYRRTGT